MAASNGQFPDVLTEGWILWLPEKELKKAAFSESSSGWKSLYFYMSSRGMTADITLYKKPTKSGRDKPFEKHSYTQFQLHKKTKCNKHQAYICEVTNLYGNVNYYAFDNEGRRDAFAFFLITQRRLPETPFTGKLFSVKPVDSDDHRKIGSRGSICHLHVCQSGVSLAFEISHSIVAQWPLNSIRNYGMPKPDQFQLEAGRRSPMGEGLYVFHTKKKEHELIFQQIDRCVAKAMEGAHGKSRDDKIYDEYCSLGILVNRQSHHKFSRDLQRISANNFKLDQAVLTVPDGNRNSSSSWHPEPMLPESKLSDVESWLETNTIPRDHKPLASGVGAPSRDSSQPMLPGMRKALHAEKPPVPPGSSRPSREKSVESSRLRSKTEDPLSLPSLPETPGYMDMRSSMQSLNILPDTSTTRRKHQNLHRTDRQLGQLSMSPSSVSRSFDALEGQTPSNRSKFDSSSSLLSPLSLATPPPTFYEAMELPNYTAPTPPSDAVPMNNRLSTESAPGGNVLALPARMRKKRGTKGSVGSCEDLTSLVRDSLVLMSNGDHNEYENAMYNTELMQNFEMSGEHTRHTDGIEMSGEHTRHTDGIEMSGEHTRHTDGIEMSGEHTRHTDGMSNGDTIGPTIDTDGALVKTVTADSQGSGNRKSADDAHLSADTSDSSQRDSSEPLHQNNTSDASSPRIDSTYLFEKKTTGLADNDTNHYIAREMAGPPPVPDIPRPYPLHKYNSVSAARAASGSNNSTTADPTHSPADAANTPHSVVPRVLPQLVETVIQSNEGTLSRPLPKPAVTCDDSANDNLRVNRSLSSTGTSSMASQVGLYEPVNEESMLENQFFGKEPTTVWHISLDGDPIDNPLPPEQTSPKDTELAQAVAAFNKIEEEAVALNAQFHESQWQEDVHGYLMPAESPPEVLLPLPPPDDGDDSEDEKPKSLFGFGSVRRMFSEMSRGRLRRTKSTDILSDGKATPPPSTSKQSVKSAAGSTQARLSSKRSKSKSSNKANNEFDFIRASTRTKQFTRAPAAPAAPAAQQ